jgi:hypothetical protein
MVRISTLSSGWASVPISPTMARFSRLGEVVGHKVSGFHHTTPLRPKYAVIRL